MDVCYCNLVLMHRVPLAAPIRIERKSVFDVKPYITGPGLC